MAVNDTNRALKGLLGLEATDENKRLIEEFGAETINIAAKEIWSDDIDPTPAQAVIDGTVALETLHVLTEDVTVPNQQAWRATFKDWIPPNKFGSAYVLQLFDATNTLITVATQINKGIFFDYKTGLLTADTVSGITLPFKLTHHRYIGIKGAGGSVDVDGTPVANQITYWSSPTEITASGKYVVGGGTTAQVQVLGSVAGESAQLDLVMSNIATRSARVLHEVSGSHEYQAGVIGTGEGGDGQSYYLKQSSTGIFPFEINHTTNNVHLRSAAAMLLESASGAVLTADATSLTELVSLTPVAFTNDVTFPSTLVIQSAHNSVGGTYPATSASVEFRQQNGTVDISVGELDGSPKQYLRFPGAGPSAGFTGDNGLEITFRIQNGDAWSFKRQAGGLGGLQHSSSSVGAISIRSAQLNDITSPSYTWFEGSQRTSPDYDTGMSYGGSDTMGLVAGGEALLRLDNVTKRTVAVGGFDPAADSLVGASTCLFVRNGAGGNSHQLTRAIGASSAEVRIASDTGNGFLNFFNNNSSRWTLGRIASSPNDFVLTDIGAAVDALQVAFATGNVTIRSPQTTFKTETDVQLARIFEVTPGVAQLDFSGVASLARAAAEFLSAGGNAIRLAPAAHGGRISFGADFSTNGTNFIPSTTFDQFIIAPGSGLGRQIILTDQANEFKDHGHAVATHPTLFLHDTTDVDIDSTHWLSITADEGTGLAEIATGAGVTGLAFRPNGGVVNFRATGGVSRVQVTADGASKLTISGAFSYMNLNNENCGIYWNNGTDAWLGSFTNTIQLTTLANYQKDHGHAARPHPSLWIHSSADPTITTNEYMRLEYDDVENTPMITSGFDFSIRLAEDSGSGNFRIFNGAPLRYFMGVANGGYEFLITGSGPHVNLNGPGAWIDFPNAAADASIRFTGDDQLEFQSSLGTMAKFIDDGTVSVLSVGGRDPSGDPGGGGGFAALTDDTVLYLAKNSGNVNVLQEGTGAQPTYYTFTHIGTGVAGIQFTRGSLSPFGSSSRWQVGMDTTANGNAFRVGNLFATVAYDALEIEATDAGNMTLAADLLTINDAGGATSYTISPTEIDAANANGPRLANVAASSTVPTLIPDRAFPTTGIGNLLTGNSITLISNGVASLNIDPSTVTATRILRCNAHIAGPSGVSPLRIGAGAGAGTPTVSAADDCYIHGDLEVNGSITTPAGLINRYFSENNLDTSVSPNNITVEESGKLFTNTGITAENRHVLPTAAAGLVFRFYNDDSDGMRIDANTADDITDGVTTAGQIDTTEVGAYLELVAVNASLWKVVVEIGAWAIS